MSSSFRDRLKRLAADNSILLGNFTSMFGATAITSLLGFAYWWLAARIVEPTEFGFASAMVSSMTLLANVGILGLGTLLVGELPKRIGRQTAMIQTALYIAVSVSASLAAAFVLMGPQVSSALQPLNNQVYGVLFVAGVAATVVGVVLDHAAVGLLRSRLQLLRNSVFAVVKLASIAAAGAINAANWAGIYTTWLLANAVSFLIFGRFRPKCRSHQPFFDQETLVALRTQGFSHHILNLGLQAPSLLTPVIVTIVLSSEINAGYFAAWTIANFAYTVPSHLATILYADASGNPRKLSVRLRFTVALSVATAMLSAAVIIPLAENILGIFGPTYSEHASVTLAILSLGVLPMAVKYHYVALERLQQRSGRAAILIVIQSIIELIACTYAMTIGGLTYLAIAWLIVNAGGALLFWPIVRRYLIGADRLHAAATG